MSIGLLAWLVAVVIWGTWAPFTLRPADEPAVLQYAPEWTGESAAHLVILTPAAVVFTTLMVAGGHRRPRLRALGFVVLLAVLIEAGQWWIEIRSVSLFDVLCGIVGASPATLLAAHLLRRGWEPRTILVPTGLLVLVAMLVTFSHAVIRQVQGQILVAFDPDYPIAAGDEVGGSRPYAGRVSDALICAGPRGDEACAGASAGLAARREIAQRAETSQRLRVSASVLSESDAQTGPARIVTFSDGPYLRNVTLGQEQRSLVLRVRTWRAGPNGTSFAFALRDAVVAGTPVRVEAEFDDGAVRISAVSAESTIRGVFDPPMSNSLRLVESNPQRVPVLLRGRALQVGAIVLFCGLGLAVTWVVRPHRLVLPVLAAAGPVVYLSLLDAGLGGALAPGPNLYLVAAGSAAAAALLLGASERESSRAGARLAVAGEALPGGLPSPEGD